VLADFTLDQLFYRLSLLGALYNDREEFSVKRLCNTLVFPAVLALVWFCTPRQAYALPSFARQTGQKCAACHVGGSWPQLTPWGRFFKLSGYTAGKSIFDKEEGFHLPVGVWGQAGLTWAAQPNDAAGNPVVEHNGVPQFYGITGEVATKVTDFLGVFYQYAVNNQFPGWKGGTDAADIRAVHFFHPAGHELLVGFDSNNSPGLQDVWNSVPAWGFPFFESPQAPGGPTDPIISSLASQSASVGAYALLDRKFYVETSFYRVANGFFRFMSAGTSFEKGDQNYLQGENPYWRAYWTTSHGPHSVMAGTFGMRASVYPDSSQPTGPANIFTDTGFDTQYQYLAYTHKITLRGSYVYEKRSWDGSYPLGASGTNKGNLKTLNLGGSYSYNAWTFHGGYLMSNGNSDSTMYGITSPAGDQVSASPKTTGYALEVDRLITQNIQVMAQYHGFLRFNGLQHNIDGLGRNATDNNTLWLSVFFAF
jgi:hypothetical protein